MLRPIFNFHNFLNETDRIPLGFNIYNVPPMHDYSDCQSGRRLLGLFANVNCAILHALDPVLYNHAQFFLPILLRTRAVDNSCFTTLAGG